MNYKEISGDLIKLAKEGYFDVIAHGCNCFCTMGAGIAVPMKENFHCNLYELEDPKYRGDINKLGQIDYIENKYKSVIAVNCYTQYYYGKNHADGKNNPLDYEALTLCLRKLNRIFKGKKIGLPQIGCGLAGGKWSIVQKLIKAELNDCDVTVVIYNK